MTIALEVALEAEMAAAHVRGDEVAFTAARNKRQAYWDYRDGTIDLAAAKRRLAKMPMGSRAKASKECLAWDGEWD